MFYVLFALVAFRTIVHLVRWSDDGRHACRRLFHIYPALVGYVLPLVQRFKYRRNHCDTKIFSLKHLRTDGASTMQIVYL